MIKELNVSEIKLHRSASFRVLSHLYHLSQTNKCPGGFGVQTPEYILQPCPTHSDIPGQIWPRGKETEREAVELPL